MQFLLDFKNRVGAQMSVFLFYYKYICNKHILLTYFYLVSVVKLLHWYSDFAFTHFTK